MPTDAKQTEKEIPQFNWTKASQEQIDLVWAILMPGFDQDEFNKKGLIRRIERKAKGRSPESIVSDYNQKIDKKKSEIPESIAELSAEELQDVFDRIGSSINVKNRYSEQNIWKAYRMLANKLKKQSLTLEEAKALDKPKKGRRGRLVIIPTEIQDTTKPNGFDPVVSEFIQKMAAGDPNIEFGRARSARPQAVIKSPNILGDNIMYITMSKEYKLPDEVIKADNDT